MILLNNLVTIYLKNHERNPFMIQDLIFNNKKYFNELSSAFGISMALENDADLIINLHSDLQDPPELSEKMLSLLLDENNL